MFNLIFILRVILAGEQCADLWTTHQVFRYGGHEGNPFVAKVMAYVGELPALWGKVVLVGVIGWLTDSIPILAGLDVIYAAVVWWNYGELMIELERSWWGAAAHNKLKDWLKSVGIMH
jgi:hypothetical protein